MLTIKIKNENQSFEENVTLELDRCVNRAIDSIEHGYDEGNIYDTNGNKVGTYKLTNR